MDKYKVVGFGSFVSKKNQVAYYSIFVTKEPSGHSNVEGLETEKFFVQQEVCNMRPFVGAECQVFFNQRGFPQHVVFE